MPDTATRKSSVIQSRFISHGTLGSRDLERTRRFYEEFLGLEVTKTSKVSMMVRLGGAHVYAVVKTTQALTMPRLNHNGIDVASDAEVDAAYRAVNEHAATWDLHDITGPVAQHGTYSFLFRDMDDNMWEILSNPAGGYSWIFEQGDLDGKGHFDPEFLARRPGRNA